MGIPLIFFQMELFDFTGTVRVTAFDDCAQKLIGEQADEVAKFLKFDSERYQSFFKSVLFKPYMFRIGAQKMTIQQLQLKQSKFIFGR